MPAILRNRICSIDEVILVNNVSVKKCSRCLVFNIEKFCVIGKKDFLNTRAVKSYDYFCEGGFSFRDNFSLLQSRSHICTEYNLLKTTKLIFPCKTSLQSMKCSGIHKLMLLYIF